MKHNKLDATLRRLAGSKKPGLMAHMVAGFPDKTKSLAMARAIVDGGADILEVQIPFSDPIADGPTIMEACDVALKGGLTIEDAISMLSTIASQSVVPVVCMAYYNSVFAYGVTNFLNRLSDAGVSGLIIPDVPPEEDSRENLITSAEESGIYLIRVVSPASSDERLRINADHARGFMYAASTFGVTGARTKLDPRLVAYLTKLKHFTNLPVAVGFGISDRDHVKQLSGVADIAIVGSAIINRYSETKDMKAVAAFVSELQG